LAPPKPVVGAEHLDDAYRRDQARETRGVLIVEGLTGVILGVVALVWPGITALALLYVIAAWAIITGAVRIMAALQLRREIPNEWFLVLGGAFSVHLRHHPGRGSGRRRPRHHVAHRVLRPAVRIHAACPGLAFAHDPRSHRGEDPVLA
jgi:hypothetical protein